MPESSAIPASLDPATERENIAARTALFNEQNPEDKFEPYTGKPKNITEIPVQQKRPESFRDVANDPRFRALPEPEQRKVIETLLSKDAKFQGLPKPEQDKVRSVLFPQQQQEPTKTKAGFNPLMLPIAAAEGLTSVVGSTAQAIPAGLAGLGTMVAGKGFEKGYEAVNKATEGVASLFRAETDEGKAVEEVLSLIPQGIHWAGEKVFEATDSPVAGAATEAAGNLALILAGGKGVKKVSEPKKGIEDAKRIEGGQVLPEAKGKEGEVQRGGDMPVVDRPKPENRQAPQEEKVAPQTAAIIEQQPPAVQPKRFTTVQDLSDGLYKLPQQGRAEMIQVLQKMKEIPPADMEVLRSEKIYHSFEDPSIKLTADESRLKAMYLEPIAREAKRIYEKLETNGVEVDDTSYVPRKVRDKGGLLDRMATGQGFHPESGRALGRRADATKERTMFAIESGGDRIVVAKASDGTLQGIKGGQPFKVADDASDLKPGSTVSYGGKDWKFTDAKTSEIEANTNLRYYKDAWAGMVDNLLQLKRMERELDFLNAWKKSPEFKKIATTATGSKVPQGWRQTDLPVLRGYHFEPHMAEVLDDFYNKPGSSALETFSKMNKVVTSSMFYNPLPHDFNVLDHWVVQRGMRWAYPPSYVDLVATTAKAIKSVVTQDADYIKMINEGAGLMYPSVLTEGFYTKLLGKLSRDPEMHGVARAFGYTGVPKLIASIYKAARHGLWAPSDMMMMQAYLEKMRNGEPVNKAIAETEKHIPNYRIPPRIGLDNQYGRALSQVMRNPVLSIFGRYHYGVLRSYGEMAKTMVNKKSTLKERGDAMGKMAMLGVMGLVVYPALSKLVQEVVGNTNAAFRRYGSAVVPYAIYEMLRGERTPEQVVQGTVTPAPVTKAMVELFTNTNLFNRQQIYNPNDSPMKIAGDVAKHAISSSYPFQQGAAIFSGKQAPYQVLESQVGIVDPTEKQVEAKRRWVERMKRKKKIDEGWTSDTRASQ